MRIVITNVFGSYNRGDALLVESLNEALLRAFSDKIKLDGIAHFPELEREHLPHVEWHQPPGRSYSSNRIERKLQNTTRAVGILIYAICGAPSFIAWLAPAAQLSGVRAIKNSDLVVSCAGGFLLDVNSSIIGNLLQLWIAQRFRKPIVLAPQTIGPIRRPWLRRLTTYLLNRCDIVCAREEFTAAFLREIGVDRKRIRLLSDMALYHSSVDPDAGVRAMQQLGVDAEEKVIGCSVVDWPFPHSSDPHAARELYYSRLRDTLFAIHSESGLRILLVNQVSSDLRLARRVARDLPFAVLDEEDRTPAEMRGMIQRCSAFIASRFHSAVFALLERVPTVALAYTYKSTGIMRAMSLEDRVFDIDDFNPNELARVVIQDLRSPDSAVRSIDRGFEQLRFPKFESVLREMYSERVGSSHVSA